MVTAEMKERKIELEEIVGPEEARARIALELSSPEGEKLKMFSELFIEEVIPAAAWTTVAEKLKLNTLKVFIENFLKFRVSKDRMGRFEMERIAVGITEEIARKKGLKSLFAMLGGVR